MKSVKLFIVLTVASVSFVLLSQPKDAHALWFNSSAGTIFGTPGTPFTLGDDDHFGPIGLNTPFNFFGETYTDIYFNSNGSLTFTEGRNSWDNYNFPASGVDTFGDAIVPTIAPFFDDHDNRFGGTLSFIDTIPGMFVATWDNVPLFGRPATTNAFQAVLFSDGNPLGFDDGTIVFNYGDLNGTGGLSDGIHPDFPESANTATIGLNNGDGENFSILFGLGIGDEGGLITPDDFPALENPELDPFFFEDDGNGNYIITAVPFSDLPELPGFTTSPVPEPATMVLLGSGLVGMIWQRRKKTHLS